MEHRATPIKCPKFTKQHGQCVIDRAIAFDICAETPGCKYVLTTSNADWNIKFPTAAMLGKDPLNYSPDWKTCEISATNGKCSMCVLIGAPTNRFLNFFYMYHRTKIARSFFR